MLSKLSTFFSSSQFKKIIIVKDDIKPWTDENGILTMGLMDFLMGDTKDLNI